MSMALEGDRSGRHYLQLWKLDHGMLLLFKRHIMPAKQKQHSGVFFFFLGYMGDVHPLTAKHRQRHRTNLICAGTTA